MRRIGVEMHIKDMMHSRFLMKGASWLCLQISPHWLRASCGQLHAFHALPKLNHIPHRIDIVPEWILSQVSRGNPSLPGQGLRNCSVPHHSQGPSGGLAHEAAVFEFCRSTNKHLKWNKHVSHSRFGLLCFASEWSAVGQPACASYSLRSEKTLAPGARGRWTHLMLMHQDRCWQRPLPVVAAAESMGPAIFQAKESLPSQQRGL